MAPTATQRATTLIPRRVPLVEHRDFTRTPPTGIVTKDATIVVADNSAARSIIRFLDTKDKVKQLDAFKATRPTNPTRLIETP